VIPVDGFLLGQSPARSGVPVRLLPKEVILSYREGVQDFTPASHVPPFEIVTLTTGSFTAGIVSGSNDSAFGLRAELRRRGVYGTILVDRLVFDVAAIQLLVEGCPDTTEEVEEASSTILTSDEACPDVTNESAETSQVVSIISSDN
jgi:hypothetical protein